MMIPRISPVAPMARAGTLSPGNVCESPPADPVPALIGSPLVAGWDGTRLTAAATGAAGAGDPEATAPTLAPGEVGAGDGRRGREGVGSGSDAEGSGSGTLGSAREGVGSGSEESEGDGTADATGPTIGATSDSTGAMID